MCKISVITPVYKVDKYLSKCIDSILNQTFTDFELIIVDDGSPDSCGKIADEYEKKDKRVRVIHKENGGAASARNAGIEMAKGEYFYFPDSDDWIEPSYLESLYDLAEVMHVQLVMSGYTMEYYEGGENQSYIVAVQERFLLAKSDVRNNIHNYFNNMMMAVPWNKLYRADYIINNRIRFPDLKWDDLHFNMEVIKNIESVAISSSAGYHFFRSRQGSETTMVFDGMLYKKRREQFSHILDVYNYWDVNNENVMATIYGYYSSRLIQCIQEISISKTSCKRELIREILSDDLNKKAIEKGTVDSKVLKIAIVSMKIGKVNWCIVVGKCMGFFKKKTPILFYKIKSTSVNKASKI